MLVATTQLQDTKLYQDHIKQCGPSSRLHRCAHMNVMQVHNDPKEAQTKWPGPHKHIISCALLLGNYEVQASNYYYTGDTRWGNFWVGAQNTTRGTKIVWATNTKSERLRDSQRKRVYKSDWELESMANYVGDINDCFDYVNYVRTEKWFKDAFPKTAKNVINVIGPKNRRQRFARGGLRGISLPARWSRHEHIIIHELAHVVCAMDGFGKQHDAGYCGVLLFLVENMMGSKAAKTLRTGYHKNRVKFTKFQF